MEVDSATLLLVPTAIYHGVLVFEKVNDLYQKKSDFSLL